MAKKAKKKVLALPITVEEESKVLLLEPGDEIITVPPEELQPTPADEAPDETEETASEEPDTADEDTTGGFADRLKAKLPAGDEDGTEEADEETDEVEEETGGFGDKIKAKLPVGAREPSETDDEVDTDADDEADEAGEVAPEEPETADEDTTGGFADRLKAKLPIGAGKAADDEEPDEPDEADVEPEAPDEPEPDDEPPEAPEPTTPEVPTETVDLEDETVGLEPLDRSGTGLSEVEVGDEPHGVTLDPIPYEPAPSSEPGTADETVEETVEPEEEPGLDPELVDRIRYNVDMAIYRTAKERRQAAVDDPRDAVDEVIAGAETEDVEPVEDRSATLPSADTRAGTVPGIDEETAGRLAEAGIETITDLVERDEVSLAVDTDLRVGDIRDWQQIAELMHVPGLEPRHAEILTEVGINRVELLADQDPGDLRKRVVQFLKYREHEPGADVTTATTQDWIDSAGRVRQSA